VDLLLTKRSIRWLQKKDQPVPYWGIFPEDLDRDDAEEWDRHIIREWDKRWRLSDVGEWTRFLFPNIRVRLEVPVNPNFYLTQGLTGHGVFGSYLHKFRRRDDPSCPCGALQQTPHHIFCECPLYVDGRPASWQNVGADHLSYILSTTKALWSVENPGHILSTGEEEDDVVHAHRGSRKRTAFQPPLAAAKLARLTT